MVRLPATCRVQFSAEMSLPVRCISSIKRVSSSVRNSLTWWCSRKRRTRIGASSSISNKLNHIRLSTAISRT